MAAEPAPQIPPGSDRTVARDDQAQDARALPPQHVVRRTRMGGVWVAAVLFAVVMLLLLIFILENNQSVAVSYFGAHGHVPLGVGLLLAAVLGVLLVVIPGTARIIQLRIVARRHRQLDVATTQSGRTTP